jgi:RNA polymerase sigma-70 factor, ECF subfamily
MQDHHIHPDVIQKLKLGDIDAFEKIFRTFYKPLTRFALQYTGSQDKAEDIVQNVMYRIWQHRKRLNKHKNLKTYLFTAVKNQALNLQKHESAAGSHILSDIHSN